MRDKFLNLLNKSDFKGAEDLLYPDIYDVEDLMELKSDEEYKKIEPHWSAVQTGELICTPLEVLKKISDHIKFKQDSTLVDIGSGHGFPSFVFGSLYPSLKVTGYEIVKEKVDGSRVTAGKLGLENVEFLEQDLSEDGFVLKSADYYYIYNSANEDILKKILHQICEVSKTKKVTVISSGGVDADYLKSKGFKEDKSLDSIGIVFYRNS